MQTAKISYYYACCPYRKTVLVQAQNGLDGYIKCHKCDKYIHIIIRNDTVTTKNKIIRNIL